MLSDARLPAKAPGWLALWLTLSSLMETTYNQKFLCSPALPAYLPAASVDHGLPPCILCFQACLRSKEREKRTLARQTFEYSCFTTNWTKFQQQGLRLSPARCEPLRPTGSLNLKFSTTPWWARLFHGRERKGGGRRVSAISAFVRLLLTSPLALQNEGRIEAASSTTVSNKKLKGEGNVSWNQVDVDQNQDLQVWFTLIWG